MIRVLPGLVLVGLRRDGDVEIVAHDARTGAERWRHQDSPAPNTSVPASSWSFDTAGDVVAYRDGDRLTVLSADGEVVRTDLQSRAGRAPRHRSRDWPADTASADPDRGPDRGRRRSSRATPTPPVTACCAVASSS